MEKLYFVSNGKSFTAYHYSMLQELVGAVLRVHDFAAGACAAGLYAGK